MIKHLAIFVFILAFQSCSDGSDCSNSVHVNLINKTGLDGCGWVLQLDDGTYLEPQNLSDFEIELVEGKDLHVAYKEVDGGSICMIGKIVELKCLSED